MAAGTMQVVAIVRLGTTVGEEAEAMAADLGTLAYEERLKLAAGVPAVVLLTPDRPQAESLRDRLRARGHEVIACDASVVVASSAMISLRRFRLESDAVVAGDLPDARLRFEDLSALLRATRRRRDESSTVVKEKKFDLARAVATGGLIRSKTSRREVTTRVDESEQILYLFPRGGATPWILHEHGTDYGALGPLRVATTAPNFLATVELFRARAPQAAYDDRLVARRLPPQPAAASEKITSANDLDLLAHLLAASLGGRR